MRHRRPGELTRSALVHAAAVIGLLAISSAVGSDARAQTGGEIDLKACNGFNFDDCVFAQSAGGGVLTATLTLPGPEVGNVAATDVEILPAEFSQSGDPEISFISFAQTISTTASIVSTIGYVQFDQDHMVETLVLTNTTSAVIDYNLDVRLQVTGDAANRSYAELATEWYMSALGQNENSSFCAQSSIPRNDVVSLDFGITTVEIDDQGDIVIFSSGHHDRDLEIDNMGDGMFQLSGSGHITATGIPINTTTTIGVDFCPSAHLNPGSSDAFAMAESNNGPGLRYTLRPLDTLVTITAVPVPEPSTPGFAAVLALAALARFRRNTRA